MSESASRDWRDVLREAICPECDFAMLPGNEPQACEWCEERRLLLAAPRSEPQQPSEVERLKDALRLVKSWVCGDKVPNWADSNMTYLSRGKIADICDIALAHPHHPKDMHLSIEARPAERPDLEGGKK